MASPRGRGDVIIWRASDEIGGDAGSCPWPS